jgi:uncharacterized glyoxalase superfamily protein PhnB
MTNVGTCQSSVAVLPTDDVLELVAYFVDVLGFSRHFVWGEPPVYAGVRADEALIYICHDPAFAQAIRENDLHPDVFIWVSGIDEHYARLRRNGANVVEALSERPWDARQYSVRAPNGYHLKFAEPIDDAME